MYSNHAISGNGHYGQLSRHRFTSSPGEGTSEKASRDCVLLEDYRKIVIFYEYNNVPENCARIFKQSMGARNRVGIGLSHRPARLHRLAELIPWNRFLGSLEV
jgi:hypothetical protein